MAVLASVMLASCGREVVVDVVKQGDVVTFAASGPDAPCVQRLVVTLAGADIDSTPPL